MSPEQRETPFSQLNEEEQKTIIDVAILILGLTTRVPTTGTRIYEISATELLRSYHLPNRAKYALRQVTDELMASDWEFTVRKKGLRLITGYTRLQGDNGQASITIPPQ